MDDHGPKARWPASGGSWVVAPGNVLVPDALGGPRRRTALNYALWAHGRPDLVTEVRSPSMWRYDLRVKREHHESTGVREVWLIDTASGVVMT